MVAEFVLGQKPITVDELLIQKEAMKFMGTLVI